MNNLDMYQIAENEHIEILNYNWNSSKGKIFEINNNYYIGINNNIITNSIEEKQIFAEELGHYYCNAMYDIKVDQTIINKCEYRAKKWAYSVLVPLKILQQKISEGITNTYDLADYFEVDCEYMYNCLNFYNNKGCLAI